MFSAPVAKAEYGIGTGVNTSGGGCKVTSSGFVTNTNQWWDTCYGLAWHYYEWPTNSDGTPVNSDIEFHCTSATCGGSTAKNKVSKECGKPEYGGGFWYLGYEVYSPDSSLDGPNDAHNVGVPVGKPRVDFLPAWVSVPGVIKNTSVTAGLYPFGAKDNANNDIYNINVLKSKDYIDIDHTGIKKANGTDYVPGRCSNYSWIGNDKARCVRDFTFWPKILINNTYYAVESKYYGTTYEAWKAFERVSNLISGGGATTFSAVNWFCSGEKGDVSGHSGVSVSGYGNVQYTDHWTNSASDHPSVTHSSSPILVNDSVTVSFYHEIKGAGNVKASFSIDQNGFKSGEWEDATWNYSNSSATSTKTYSMRSRVVTASELSTSGTTICDTMTFDGNIQSTACVTLKKAQVAVPRNNVNGRSSVTAGGKSATSEATNGGNGAEKSVTVHVPVMKGSESTNIVFNHIIAAAQSVSGATQNANGIQYSIAQSTSGTAGGASASSYSLATTTNSLTVSASSPTSTLTAGNPTITVSGITASTDYTVCQTMTLNYGGGSARTTKVCARIIGHQISSSSTVKNKDSGATKTSNTDGGTANLTAADVIVVNGSKTINLNFSHDLSLTRHSGVTDTISANVSYKVTQSKTGSGATVTDYGGNTGSKSVTNASAANVVSKDITVSNITASTDITVCQTLEATYSSKTRTTKVCARIVGSSVSSYSSVKYGSNDAKSTSANGGTAWEYINITVPNGGSQSVTVHFNHGISYSSAVSGELSSTTTYTVTQKRDNGAATTVKSGSETLTMSAAVPKPNKSVSSGDVTISGITNSTDTKICQTLVATRGDVTRTTTACARIVGNPVTGYSNVSHTQAGDKTATSNNTTETLDPVYVTVLPGASNGTAVVKFVHTAKITRTSNDSGTISTGDVPYTITQTLDGLSASNVTTFNTVSANTSLTLAATTPSAVQQLKSTDITVSGITPSTDGKVCQTLSISGHKTTVCARIKGRSFAVYGQSSVGNSASDIKNYTGWKRDNTSVTGDLGSIYTPYNGTSSKDIYFKHELAAQLSGNTYANVGTGNITYSIIRGSTNVATNQTTSFTVSDGNLKSDSVWANTVSSTISNGDNKICQKIGFTYGNTSGNPEACATVKGVPPTFTGSSAATANGASVTASTNGETVNLPEIKIKVAYTKTVTQRIYFGHNMTASSDRTDARGKSTGVMDYRVSRDYGVADTTGGFSGTFPNDKAEYTSPVGTSGDYVDVTVGPNESKTVCQTITFSGWSTKACATVTGELSLPDLRSQSSISYVTSSNTRSATTEWADKNSSTKSAEISSTIYLPVREVEEGNGGKEMSLDFVHNIMAALTDNLSWQNTGDVPYTITTTHNGSTVDTINGVINHSVSAANIAAIANINSNTHTFKVKQGENIRVCQAFAFSYKGANFNTTVCANIVGIPADPQGRSSARIVGYEGVADTAWVNGRVSRVALEVDRETLKGSDVVFNHFIQLAGLRTITIENFTITNDYDSKYSASGDLTYTGYNEGSYSQYSFYTNGRPTAITTADAQGMYDKGSACETLSFDYEGINYTSTACIDFKKTVPPTYQDSCPDLTSYHSATSGETLSYSYVKSDIKPDDRQTLIYAKPTDKITFTHCYYPGAQETRYTNADESLYNTAANNGKTVIIPVRNAYIETANDIEIKDKEDTNTFVFNNNNYTFDLYGQILNASGRIYTGVIGNYNHTMFISSETSITAEAVGETLEQSLWSHHGNNATLGHDRANCGSNCLVYYKNGDDNNWYNITANNTTADRDKSSAAQVIVPYNYRTTAKIDTPSDVVYPGETMTGGSIRVDVNKRNNGVVGGPEYATRTAASTVKLYTFFTENSGASEGADHQTTGTDIDACGYYNGLGYGDTCVKLGEVNKKGSNDLIFNAASNIAGTVNEAVAGFEASYNVPDLPAGSKVCMGVSIYPAESTDTEPSNGNTFVSKAYCRTVAKKPSFQIWGGSLYSAGNVLGTVATKYTIKGVNDASYSPFRTPGEDGVNFGSWVEHGIVANGVINNVSSGAGTGYGLPGMVVDAAHPGGAIVSGSLTGSDFCNRSRLSFANITCASGHAGNFGAGGGSATKTSVRQEFAEKAEANEKAAGVERGSSDTWTAMDLSLPTNYTQIDNMRYTFVENGNLAITASENLDPGITHIVYVKKGSVDNNTGNIVIYGTGAALSYGDGTYQTTEQIPQYIIIADKNLYIDRLVTRIDAVLVAGGTINSCAKYVGDEVVEATKDVKNEIKDVFCNQQLKINGVVIADTMKLYRIYGASTGLNSITPAEIINYSPSIYLWGDDNGSTGSPEMHTTYLKELAPRQ
ncbi:hypothetical protein IKX64_00405 [Candidatus Saccharibacteria bacterium]|nr:hypothetical protein [Candidatus Saccharibacteria bacterium]